MAEWVRSVLGSVAISDTTPDSEPTADVVVYPLSLSPRQSLQEATGREPVRFGLRCLIFTQGEQAPERLQQLVVAALTSSEWTVELEALPAELWRALAVTPRPAFVLDVDVAVPRPQPSVSLVVHPPTIELAASQQLEGQILGPESVPIPRARVELVGLNRRVETDDDGRFTFPSVPREGRQRLRISAKGRHFVATTDLATDREPLVIRCEPLEE